MIERQPLQLTQLLPLLFATLWCSSGFALEENTMVSVTRIEIEIDRPAEVVWPYVQDFSKWSTNGFTEQLSGAPGEVGSILRRTIPSGENKQVRTEEVLFVEPEKRLVMRVHPEPNPTNMMVIANIELLPKGDKATVFQLDVYMKTEAPGDDPIPHAQLVAEQTATGDGMTQPLTTGYARLKDVVEAENPLD